jgi:hypothetical protein
VQGSNFGDATGSQATESMSTSPSIDLNLGQLLYAVNGAWAASVVQGSWGSSTGLQSSISSSPTAFINTTTWCGATWGESFALVERVTSLEKGNLGGIIVLDLDGTAVGGKVPDQLRQQCKVRFLPFCRVLCLWRWSLVQKFSPC